MWSVECGGRYGASITRQIKVKLRHTIDAGAGAGAATRY